MKEQYFFDIAKVNNVATDAVTVGNMFSSPEEETILPVKADDGNTYDVVAWGDDNQLPYDLKEKVEKNSSGQVLQRAYLLRSRTRVYGHKVSWTEGTMAHEGC